MKLDEPGLVAGMGDEDTTTGGKRGMGQAGVAGDWGVWWGRDIQRNITGEVQNGTRERELVDAADTALPQEKADVIVRS